jgi:hypothetical protein
MIGKGDITAQVGKTLKAQEEETHLFLGYRVVETGLGVPPEETPKILGGLPRNGKISHRMLSNLISHQTLRTLAN